ncbi:MAG: hypothetical protein MSC45_06380, partial [Mobiluncus sp.]|uniref:hypothetical protein n=1 Tax=Mobiluncus sp. TaxID=47293 RepID=UPI002591044D
MISEVESVPKILTLTGTQELENTNAGEQERSAYVWLTCTSAGHSLCHVFDCNKIFVERLNRGVAGAAWGTTARLLGACNASHCAPLPWSRQCSGKLGIALDLRCGGVPLCFSKQQVAKKN